jgi:glycogen synthase
LLLSGEHPSVPERTGGIGSFVACAAEALAEAGHEVHLLVCSPGLARHDRTEGLVEVHVRGLAPPGRLVRGAGPRLLTIAASCRWHARQLGPFDAIESPEWEAIAAAFTLRRRAPLVVSLQTPAALISAHEPRSGPPRRTIDALERLVARRADAVMSVSTLLVEELRHVGWLSSTATVEISPPVVDAAAWATVPSARHSEPVVLGIGRLEPRKGFDHLIEAVARLDGPPDLQVELVGGDTSLGAAGSHGAHLRRLADRLDVRLHLHGRVPRSELPPLLARARVVALPSTFDSFNMAGLEALAAGRATVVTTRVGLAELDDGSGALSVVPVGDPARLAEALAPLVNDAERAADAGAAGRRLVSQLDRRTFAAQRIACYERLAHRQTAARTPPKE